MQVKEVLYLHLVDELGQKIHGVPPTTYVCCVIRRSVFEFVIKSHRMNFKFIFNCFLYHFESWLWNHQHTFSVCLSALWKENDWSIWNIHSFPQLFETGIESSYIAFLRETDPTCSTNNFKHANCSHSCFTRLLIEVHGSEKWSVLSLKICKLNCTSFIAEN